MQLKGWRLRLVNHCQQERAIITAHHARTDRRAQDIAQALADMLGVSNRPAIGSAHADITRGHSGAPVVPPLSPGC